MKVTVAIVFSIISGLASCTSLFNGGQTFFRHRVEPAERSSSSDLVSEERQDPQDVAAQILKRYYHAKSTNFQLHGSPKYELNSPDKVRWLMENILHLQQGSSDVGSDRYSSSPLKGAEDELQLQLRSSYDSGENDELEYSDVYGLTSLINDQIPMDSSFQQALSDYLMQQSNHEEESDSTQEQNSEDLATSDKNVAASQIKFVDSKSSSTYTTPSPSESLSKTADSFDSPTASSNSLDVMPPVHFGKGQKEYPMLRPASENSRKYDSWAEKMQNSMMKPVRRFGQSEVHNLKKSYADDPVMEQLNKLKAKSQQVVKRS